MVRKVYNFHPMMAFYEAMSLPQVFILIAQLLPIAFTLTVLLHHSLKLVVINSVVF